MTMSPSSPADRASNAAGRKRWGCLGCLYGSLAVVALAGFILLGLRVAGVKPPIVSESVAVIYIDGPIYESTEVMRTISKLRRTPLIKAVVLRIDSPGGAVAASEEIYREALRVREESKKPLVVSMGNSAASGGYLIAVAADEIIANGGTITGSIGVIATDVNLQEILRRIGVRPEVIKSGEHKDTGSPFRDMTQQDIALLRGVVFDMYRQFFRAVLKARHKQIDEALRKDAAAVDRVVAASLTKQPAEAGAAVEYEAFTTGTMAAAVGTTTESEALLRSVADGRILTGEQALTLGLIDRIGTLNDAVERAGVLAGLGKTPRIVERFPTSDLPALFGLSARRFYRELTGGGADLEYRSHR